MLGLKKTDMFIFYDHKQKFKWFKIHDATRSFKSFSYSILTLAVVSAS